MAYTTIDNPELYFQSVLWTGNGSNPRTITFGGDENMQPDLLWYKCRSHAVPHILLDSVRGAGNDKELSPNSDLQEGSQSSETDGFISAFTSDGFTLAAGSSGGDHYTNEGSRTFVAWGWKESADAGFDIVTYTGSGSAQNISHSLSAVPEFFPTKRRSGTNQWRTYHVGASDSATDYTNLDTTDAFGDDATIFNDTMPTSSVFTVGTDSGINGSSETYVTYLWTGKQGFSKFGSYIGNGSSDGTFVYTGFKPAWVMMKRTDSSGYHWEIWDNKRNTFNLVNTGLTANVNYADFTETFGDFLSNGFKIRGTNANKNASGGTYIYMAFAEAPFVNSNGVPCNAR